LYYASDAAAGTLIARLLKLLLSIEVPATSHVDDPRFFGPGVRRPHRGLIELYLAAGALPALDATGAQRQ